jgi:hypothetical protein
MSEECTQIPNAGIKWSAEDDKKLEDILDSILSPAAQSSTPYILTSSDYSRIASIFQRTTGAIRSRITQKAVKFSLENPDDDIDVVSNIFGIDKRTLEKAKKSYTKRNPVKPDVTQKCQCADEIQGLKLSIANLKVDMLTLQLDMQKKLESISAQLRNASNTYFYEAHE